MRFKPGVVVGNFTVVKRLPKRMILVQCKHCGNEKPMHATNIAKNKGCGCLRDKNFLGNATRRHGMKNSREYHSFMGMKARCYNRRRKDWKHYGGRGISVCRRWIEGGFETFFADMGRCPKGLTLERKDNSKGYGPRNCKWATSTEQNNNRRNSVSVQIDGQRWTAAMISNAAGITRSGAAWRIRSGKTGDALLRSKM